MHKCIKMGDNPVHGSPFGGGIIMICLKNLYIHADKLPFWLKGLKPMLFCESVCGFIVEELSMNVS